MCTRYDAGDFVCPVETVNNGSLSPKPSQVKISGTRFVVPSYLLSFRTAKIWIWKRVRLIFSDLDWVDRAFDSNKAFWFEPDADDVDPIL